MTKQTSAPNAVPLLKIFGALHVAFRRNELYGIWHRETYFRDNLVFLNGNNKYVASSGIVYILFGIKIAFDRPTTAHSVLLD